MYVCVHVHVVYMCAYLITCYNLGLKNGGGDSSVYTEYVWRRVRKKGDGENVRKRQFRENWISEM